MWKSWNQNCSFGTAADTSSRCTLMFDPILICSSGTLPRNTMQSWSRLGRWARKSWRWGKSRTWTQTTKTGKAYVGYGIVVNLVQNQDFDWRKISSFDETLQTDQIEGAEFEFLGLEIRFERNKSCDFRSRILISDSTTKFWNFDFRTKILNFDRV